jgi:hypothetical protein
MRLQVRVSEIGKKSNNYVTTSRDFVVMQVSLAMNVAHNVKQVRTNARGK